MPLFILPLSESQEQVLTGLSFPKGDKSSPSLLSSSGPVAPSTAKEMYEKRKTAVSEVGHVCGPLVMDQWPKSEEEFCQALCSEPKNVLDWRRRNFLMLAVAKNMVFVADEKVGSSQELITLLTVARAVRAKTLGVLPAGSVPFSVPSTILAAADLVMSGEADGDTAHRVLQSLTQEG